MTANMPSLVPQAFVAGPFGAADATASKIYTLFYTKYQPLEITKVYITNDVAVTEDATNFLQVSIESGSDNAGGTALFECDTRANHEGTLAAGTLYELNETEGTVALDNYIVINVTEGGDERSNNMMVILYYVEGSPASE